MAFTRALLFWGFHFAVGSDVESMIQHAVEATPSLEVPEAFRPISFDADASQEMLRHNLTLDVMSEAMERDFPFADKQASMKAAMEAVARSAKEAFAGSEESLKKSWEEFHRAANSSGEASPKELFKQTRAALWSTGLLSEISRAMQTAPLLKPDFDSVVVGFDVSLGPWTQGLGLPATKGRGKLFVNWGFEGDDIRACVSAVADDSPTHVKWRHHKHPKQVGPNLLFGLAKWDDVPGWSFGTASVLDIQAIDVEDFGMKWTLNQEPQPACLFLDLCVFDSQMWKTLVSLEQTDAEIEDIPLDDPRASYSFPKVLAREWMKALAPTPPPKPPLKASMFVERTWCNQDYVLGDEPLEAWRRETAAKITPEGAGAAAEA